MFARRLSRKRHGQVEYFLHRKGPVLRRIPFDSSLTSTRRTLSTEKKRRIRMNDAQDRSVYFSEALSGEKLLWVWASYH